MKPRSLHFPATMFLVLSIGGMLLFSLTSASRVFAGDLPTQLLPAWDAPARDATLPPQGGINQSIVAGQHVHLAPDVVVALGPDSAAATLSYDPATQAIELRSTGNLHLAEVRGLGDVTITAETITLRDTATTAMLIQASGSLIFDADLIDIFALNHPDSWLRSGGDMIFRSPNPIRGDAHYMAGGDIRMEDRRGAPMDLISPEDPILFAQDSVSLSSYTGASLHILAGGSISVNGNITITEPDTTAAHTIHPDNNATFNGSDPISALASVALSNGETVTVNGNSRPTLDLRAGIDWTSFAGGAPVNGWVGSGSGESFLNLGSAAINVQLITINASASNGMVLLTNRYRSRNTSGAISVGGIDAATLSGGQGTEVVIDSKGTVNIAQINTGSSVNADIVNAGRGGSVMVLSEGNLTMTDSNTVGALGSAAFTHAGGGDIFLLSRQGDVTFGLLNSGYNITTIPVTTGPAGNITVTAPNGQIRTSAPAILAYNSFSAGGSSPGRAGDVTLRAGTGFVWPSDLQIRAETWSGGTVTGRSGDVLLHTDTGDIVLGYINTHNRAINGSVYRSGAITLHTDQGSVQITGGLGLSAYASSADGMELAQNGTIVISATTGISSVGTIRNDIAAGAVISDTGTIHLHTSGGNIALSGAINNAATGQIASGNAGGVRLEAPAGTITVGGTIDTRSTASAANGQAGRGGDVTISANGAVQTASISSSGSVGSGGSHGGGGHITLTSTAGNVAFGSLNSGYNVTTIPLTTGPAGDITLTALNGEINTSAPALFASNSLSASGSSAGPAGDVTLRAATGFVWPTTFYIWAQVWSGGAVTGRSGDVVVHTDTGDIVVGYIYTHNRAITGSGYRSGAMTLRTGQGGVQITGTFGLSAYASSADGNEGQQNGAIVINATTGISSAGTIRNNIAAGRGGDTGVVYLRTIGGNITLSGAISNEISGQTASGNAGGVRLEAPAGTITVSGTIDTRSSASEANGQAGRGGDVVISANGTVQTAGISSSGSVGSGGSHSGAGHITLTSTAGNVAFGSLGSGFGFNSIPVTTGPAGDITLTALNGQITTTTTSLFAFNFLTGNGSSAGRAGDVTLRAATGFAWPSNFQIRAEVWSSGTVTGRSGNVVLHTAAGNLGLQYINTLNRAATGSTYRSGDITLSTGNGAVQINNTAPFEALNAYVTAASGAAPEVSGSIVITATSDISIQSSSTTSISSRVRSEGAGSAAGDSGAFRLTTSGGNISVSGAIANTIVGRSAAGNTGGVELSAPNGAITVGNTISTSTIVLEANGVAGHGGAVTLQARNTIQTGNIYTSIDTAVLGVGSSHAGGGDILLHSTEGSIAFSTLGTGVSRSSDLTVGDAGDITVMAPSGQISVLSSFIFAAHSGAGSSGTLGAGGTIRLQAGTGFTFPSNLSLRSDVSNSGNTVSGRSGDVLITTTSGDIVLGSIFTLNRAATGSLQGAGSVSIETGAGDVVFTAGSPASINAFNQITSGTMLGPSGSVVITATGSITLTGGIANRSDILSDPGVTSSSGDSGAVRLFSRDGNISVGGTISNDTAGFVGSGNAGGVRLEAPAGAITTGDINSNSSARNAGATAGTAGAIMLTAAGDLQSGFLTANSVVGADGTASGGGVITLTSTNATLTTASVQAVSAPASSGPAGTIRLSGNRVRVQGTLQAIGQPDSGEITITHGGNGTVPFVVGDATVNGTNGSLETLQAQINPTRSFLYSYTQSPNIRINAVDGPTGLAISKQVSQPTADVGDTLTYTIVLSNSGAVDATGLELIDTLPDTLAFDAWAVQPVGATQVGQVISWSGDLAAGANLPLTFTVTVLEGYATSITNRASFGIPGDDPSSGFAEAAFTVVDPPNVRIAKAVTPTEPVLPGQPITYTLTIDNDSTTIARSVVVTDSVPLEVVDADVVATGVTITQLPGAAYQWQLADLAPGQTGTITITGRIDPAIAATTSFTNTATINALGDADSSDNAASTTTTVVLPTVRFDSTTYPIGESDGTLTLTLELSMAQPYRPIDVTVATSDDSATGGEDYAPINTTLTFAPGETRRTLALTISEDDIAEPTERFSVVPITADGALVGTNAPAIVEIGDNDVAGVTVAPTTITTVEGGATDSYTIRLTSQPTADVTITITPDLQVTTDMAALTFTPADWNVAQTVTVSAIEDSLYEGLHTGEIIHSADSSDLNYTVPAASVTVTITDVNLPPTAAAGDPQTVGFGAAVSLDGRGSSDPDGALPLTYRWTQTGGTSVMLSDSTAAQPTFTAPDSPTVLTFTLVVTDREGLVSTPATVTVTVIQEQHVVFLPLITNRDPHTDVVRGALREGSHGFMR